MQADNNLHNVNIGGMRIPYKDKSDAFTEDQLVSKEPIKQFHAWFTEASQSGQIDEPNAMCLATATKEGRPSARMVLLKGYGEDGFKFFTNHASRKGQEILSNPYGALNFFWEKMRRCIRIEGTIKTLSDEESAEYFKSRPISSQIGAVVSPQSQPIPNRDYLSNKEKELQEKVDRQEITVEKPATWGGFILVPESVEFWQGQTNRIHDRIRFRRPNSCDKIDGELLHRGEEGWVYERLAP